MLRINLMTQTQSEALLAFLTDRLREEIRRGVQQKEIAARIGVSGAQVTRWNEGGIAGMRLDNAEAFARALKLTLVEAIQAAVARSFGKGDTSIRDNALRRVFDLLSPDVVANVLGSPGDGHRTELDWVKIAIDAEVTRRALRGEESRSSDATEASSKIAAAKGSARDEETPAPMTQKKPKRSGR